MSLTVSTPRDRWVSLGREHYQWTVLYTPAGESLKHKQTKTHNRGKWQRKEKTRSTVTALGLSIIHNQENFGSEKPHFKRPHDRGEHAQSGFRASSSSVCIGKTSIQRLNPCTWLYSQPVIPDQAETTAEASGHSLVLSRWLCTATRCTVSHREAQW